MSLWRRRAAGTSQTCPHCVSRAGTGSAASHPTLGLGQQLPLFTAPGTHCSEAGPSLAEMSLCSLSCTEQSPMAGTGDRNCHCLDTVTVCSGGRGDGGLSQGSQAVPKARGLCCCSLAPSCDACRGKGQNQEHPLGQRGKLFCEHIRGCASTEMWGGSREQSREGDRVQP